MHTLHSNTKWLGGSRDNMWLMTLWHLSCSALWCIGLCCALGSKRERMRGMEGNRNDGRTDGRKDGRREEDEVGEYALPCRAEKFHGCPSRNSVWVWEVYTSNVVVGMWRLEQVSNLRNKKELSGIWACSVRNGNQRLSILLLNLSMPRIPTLNTCPFGSFVFARGLSLLGGGGGQDSESQYEYSAARRYISNPSLFCFDLTTSVPFSYYDLYCYEVTRVTNIAS